MTQRWSRLALLSFIAIMPIILAMSRYTSAQCLNPCSPCAEDEEEEYHEPCDLLLMDFFSTGWNQR